MTIEVRKDTAFVLKKDAFGSIYLQSPKSGVHQCARACSCGGARGRGGDGPRWGRRYVLDASTGDFVDEVDKHQLIEVRVCVRACVCRGGGGGGGGRAVTVAVLYAARSCYHGTS